MKRILISITFIIISLIASALKLGYISGKSDLYIAKINQTDKLMRKSDFESAIIYCKINKDNWENDTTKLNYTINHEYTEKISISLSKMCAYAENGNPDLYFAESDSVKKQLTLLKEAEFPNIENII